MKTLSLFFLGFITGAVLCFIFVYYFYNSAASEFVDTQISEQEHMSVDTFNHYPNKSSNFVQINYGIFIKKALDTGLISKFEYHRASSLANIRLCIDYEESGEIDKAKKFCKWASDHLSQWNHKLNFIEFKKINIEAREKKAIPEISLKIINEH